MKNHQKSSKITKNVPKRDLKFCHASKIQFWPVKCLCASPMTTNTSQTIQGATTGPMVASESTVRDLISVRKNSKKSENPKILTTRGQQKIKVPIGPSLALECKCAFGAKIMSWSVLYCTWPCHNVAEAGRKRCARRTRTV